MIMHQRASTHHFILFMQIDANESVANLSDIITGIYLSNQIDKYPHPQNNIYLLSICLDR